MKVVISSGHSKKVRGAVGPSPWGLEEVTEARKVTEQIARVLRGMAPPVEVVTFHDDTSTSQSQNLDTICAFHNSQKRDLDCSIHFNAYQVTDKPMGTECLYVTQADLAKQVSSAIADAGHFLDRGPKKRTDLAFLNKTNKPAILVETCFVDSRADADLYRANFAAICQAVAQAISGKEVGPTPPPKPTPEPEPEPTPGTHPEISQGDKGPAVVELQTKLGVLYPDGDFGAITDTWVRAFQAACDLTADGDVGPMTWDEVDDLAARVEEGAPRLPPELASQISKMAHESEIQEFEWPDRGMTPPGYIAGMCLSFAYAMNSSVVEHMSGPLGHPEKDALAWYEKEFAQQGMSVKTPGIDMLRHLFVMQIGLGPRESSARYCEGRDLSADNVDSETAECSLFQTSWNIRSASSAIPPLLVDFWENPNGFLSVWKENVGATRDNLSSYGSGDGARYQFLSRFCPLFHVMVTAVGMRVLRQHWGPINRREVTIRREADDLLKSVQQLVESVA